MSKLDINVLLRTIQQEQLNNMRANVASVLCEHLVVLGAVDTGHNADSLPPVSPDGFGRYMSNVRIDFLLDKHRFSLLYSNSGNEVTMLHEDAHTRAHGLWSPYAIMYNARRIVLGNLD